MNGSPVRSLDFEAYWSRYLPYLLVILSVFTVGLLFGSLATGVLTAADDARLALWLGHVVGWEQNHLFSTTIYRAALMNNLKLVGLLYILGISVVGIPLVLAILFLRGFVIGFAFAFLTRASGTHILGVILATVVAQNLFMIPIYVVAGTLALWFSWNLVRRDHVPRTAPWKALGGYTLVSALISAAMFWATAVEVAGSPFLLHLVGVR